MRVIMLNDEQGRVLTRLARQALQERLLGRAEDPVGHEELEVTDFREERGVFVTLHKNGSLRGCIGSLSATESIVDGVRRNAISAAFHDYRFPSLTAEELTGLRISVSVLTEPERLAYTDADDLLSKLRPNVDGVILRDTSGGSATFLPQVWEQLPMASLFLTHLCRKAGLADDTWRTRDIEVRTYQVQYFEEGR